MQYLIGFACVLGLSLTSVASAVHAQEPPTFMLRVSYFYDVDVDPVSAQPGHDEAPASREPTVYTLEELELRRRRAAFALVASAAVTVAGTVSLALAYRLKSCAPYGESCRGLLFAGYSMTGLGAVLMITTGILTGVRRAELRSARADSAIALASPGELEPRLKRAKIGFGVSAGLVFAGAVAMLAGVSADPLGTGAAVAIAGLGFAFFGVVGMIASGALLRVRKRQLRGLQAKPHHETPRRVRWDPAQSRIVF